MRMSKENVELFYKLFPALLFYTNQQMKKIKNVSTLKEFTNLSTKNKLEIRNALWDNINLIDYFIKKNPFNFSVEELRIIQNWKNFIKRKFCLVRYLKNYTVFFDINDHNYAYGVLALNDEFAGMLGPQLPVILEMVLLPFKEQIIYDGLMMPYKSTFGRFFRQNINNIYLESKSKYGIITSLPFSMEGVKESDAGRLRFYIRNQHNREMYSEEIEELINKNSNLLVIYHLEMGKIRARRIEKDCAKLVL
ncbi:MAG: hypothetical protein KAH35_09135 [Candidatus Atribacteria bacterium]|nr:hypothetical protein [Candidatus Atribacteria bacterium]